METPLHRCRSSPPAALGDSWSAPPGPASGLPSCAAARPRSSTHADRCAGQTTARVLHWQDKYISSPRAAPSPCTAAFLVLRNTQTNTLVVAHSASPPRHATPARPPPPSPARTDPPATLVFPA